MSETPGGAPAVLVMAKAPRPGRVKTRLQPLMGEEGCARLATMLLQHTVAVTTGQGLRTFVAHDPPDSRSEMARLLPAGVRMLPQCAGDLGQRMTTAVEEVFLSELGPLLVIGTDTPTLTGAILTAALRRLDSGSDVVLGPALDGGYYLIGVRAPHTGLFGIDPAMWSGPHVLEATLARAADAELEAALLPPLRDLDTPEDARALLADPLLPAPVSALITAGEMA